MLCLCHYGPALLLFWFQTDLGRQNLASLKMQAGNKDAFNFSHHSHVLVTLHVEFLCPDWSKLDRWVHMENSHSILKLVCLDSWSWQSFARTCDVFNCLFPRDVQNEIQLISSLLFMASLFIVFLVEKCVACQSRKSHFGWRRFRFLPCLMRIKEDSKNSPAILALLDSYRELHLEW